MLPSMLGVHDSWGLRRLAKTIPYNVKQHLKFKTNHYNILQHDVSSCRGSGSDLARQHLRYAQYKTESLSALSSWYTASDFKFAWEHALPQNVHTHTQTELAGYKAIMQTRTVYRVQKLHLDTFNTIRSNSFLRLRRQGYAWGHFFKWLHWPIEYHWPMLDSWGAGENRSYNFVLLKK